MTTFSGGNVQNVHSTLNKQVCPSSERLDSVVSPGYARRYKMALAKPCRKLRAFSLTSSGEGGTRVNSSMRSASHQTDIGRPGPLRSAHPKRAKRANHFSAYTGNPPPLFPPLNGHPHTYIAPRLTSLEQDANRRRKMNERRSLIYRLFPEVLSLVAAHLPQKCLVRATHVSHRWRAILLSFPSLWSDLSLLCEEQALEFLKRSGAMLYGLDKK